MREIVFQLQNADHGRLSARAEHPRLQIEAATLEELHHEAREALIQHFGPSHGAYRVRLQRPPAGASQAPHRNRPHQRSA